MLHQPYKDGPEMETCSRHKISPCRHQASLDAHAESLDIITIFNLIFISVNNWQLLAVDCHRHLTQWWNSPVLSEKTFVFLGLFEGYVVQQFAAVVLLQGDRQCFNRWRVSCFQGKQLCKLQLFSQQYLVRGSQVHTICLVQRSQWLSSHQCVCETRY